MKKINFNWLLLVREDSGLSVESGNLLWSWMVETGGQGHLSKVYAKRLAPDGYPPTITKNRYMHGMDSNMRGRRALQPNPSDTKKYTNGRPHENMQKVLQMLGN
jgi:hypothetical protein